MLSISSGICDCTEIDLAFLLEVWYESKFIEYFCDDRLV